MCDEICVTERIGVGGVMGIGEGLMLCWGWVDGRIGERILLRWNGGGMRGG